MIINKHNILNNKIHFLFQNYPRSQLIYTILQAIQAVNLKFRPFNSMSVKDVGKELSKSLNGSRIMRTDKWQVNGIKYFEIQTW